MSFLLFLSGFSNGPALHYCYSSGTLRADLMRVLSDRQTFESQCGMERKPAASCCASLADESAGDTHNCCDDFELKIELRDYSLQQLANPLPSPAWIQLFAVPFLHVFSALLPAETARENYSYFDPGLLRSGTLPLFIQYAVFRI